MRNSTAVLSLFVVSCLSALMIVSNALAESIVISPAVDGAGHPLCGASEEFEDVANSLKPGDELILKGGVYCQTARRAITVRGLPDQPITIRAADGEKPVLTRLDEPTQPQSQNGIEIFGEHLIIRGLRFERGDSGIRILGGSHHVTMEDCEVCNTSNNLVTLNSGDTQSCTFRRMHVHHSGLLDASYGTTEGEGFYVGGNNATAIARDHLFENNYIHHLRSTSDGGNDGIELKYGSHGNTIRNNVIHDTTIGMRYPGIFVYGVRDADVGSPNIVEGNVIWNAGEAIQVVSDAIVRNNLILNSDVGITAAGHAQVPVRRNVTIVNNTIAGHAQTGLYIRWSGASRMVLANNAIYCPGRRALDASGLGDSTVTVKANLVTGSGVTFDGVGFLDGGAMADAFVSPGTMDFWPKPGSPLLGKADPAHVPAKDFNETPRTSPYDAGAYETEGKAENPGWKVAPEFKGTTQPPGGSVPPSAPVNLRLTS